MSVKIQFLGAAGTVTGSKYLVKTDKIQILIDCGLFQGKREWRERNWHKPDIALEEIDAVLITHAHIDHTGMLPRYYRMGLNCPVYATAPSMALSKLLLPDSGRLQEEETDFRIKKGYSRHKSPEPLYTEKDARGVCELFRPIPFGQKVEIAEGVSATWQRMGHILGAASIQLSIEGRTISFSGDVGRYDVPILENPQAVEFADLLLIESTYGSRLHHRESPEVVLEKVVNQTAKRRGAVIIPSFAVGRTQLILYYLRELKEQNRIPDIPVIIDSPMATDATEIYRQYPDCYDEAAMGIIGKGKHPFSMSKLYFTQSSRESKKLNSIMEPMIIISASGMLSGGRILHHLFHRISSPNNTILFVGYQPPGGRGDWILSGASSLRVFGQEIEIKAQIEEVSGLSAHADQSELLRWCEECNSKPNNVALVHGEPSSAEAFQRVLEEKFSWNVFQAGYLQEYVI